MCEHDTKSQAQKIKSLMSPLLSVRFMAIKPPKFFSVKCLSIID